MEGDIEVLEEVVAEATRVLENPNSFVNKLPTIASRKSKWRHSTYHNITALVGAGLLGLPHAMSQLGWVPGIIVIVFSWVITLYTLWQLVNLHEVVPGKRFDRYPELGIHAFGPTRGYWIVYPQQLAVQVATNIVFMVTGGSSLKKSWDLTFPRLGEAKHTYFMLAFCLVQLFLSQIPNFSSLKLVSLVAAVMASSYSVIATVTCIIHGTKIHRTATPSYEVRGKTNVAIVLDAFEAIGMIAFSFAGHSIVLEIQATMPSTPEISSAKPMWKGVVVAYSIIAVCFLAIAISGFWAFGNTVEDDILLSLEQPSWLIALANFMVFMHVVGSYQVFAMPVFEVLEAHLVANWNFPPGILLRMITRTIYVGLTACIGITVPFFGALVGFFGGLIFAPITYFIPCIMWITIHKPKIWSIHWVACWVSIIIGLLIMIISPIGGARELIIQFKTYKFLS